MGGLSLLRTEFVYKTEDCTGGEEMADDRLVQAIESLAERIDKLDGTSENLREEIEKLSKKVEDLTDEMEKKA